ncbi:MAG: hypothetical protein ACKV2T_34660 [Kofleriaceae bacterium]
MKSGYWDEDSQIMLVLPARERVVRADFLVMGRPGVDGIEFGYRRGKTGIWAFYPMEDRFVRVATTTADLIDRYTSGRINPDPVLHGHRVVCIDVGQARCGTRGHEACRTQ